MSNLQNQYQLTTDLIADCMALIPQNLEKINDNYEFEVQKRKDGLYFTDAKKLDFTKFEDLDYGYKMLQVFILSHCLRTIPEFQAENPEKLKFAESYTKNGDEYSSIMLDVSPQTIASATLHGQGEYPPSTLEELCESYKNVMSK